MRFRALMLLAAAGLSAVAGAGDNLFPQGGFESDPKGGWHLPSPEWRIEDGAGYAGSRGLVFDLGKGSKTVKWPWTDKVAVEPGTRYRVSVRVKFDDFRCEYGHFTVGLGWNRADGKGLGSSELVQQVDNAVNQDGWIRYEAVTPPLDAAAATAFFWIWAPAERCTGRLRMDDFTLVQESSEPGVLSVQTSAYRDLAAEGGIELRASYFANPLKYPPDRLRGAFLFRGPDGDRRVAASLADGIAAARIEASDLAIGAQPIRFALETAAGERLGEASVPFSRVRELPRRRVWIDRHHRTIVDGRPFFPLGMYWSEVSEANIAVYTNGPFNCLMPYHRPSRGQLDQLWKAGLRVMYPAQGAYKGCTPEKSLDYVRRTLGEFKDHPALLAWYICDELPVALGDRLVVRNRFIAENDPEHPTWIVLDKPHHVRPFLGGYDVIGMDPYPIGNHGDADRTEIGIASDWVRRAKEGMFGFRPMWNVPQTFNWGWYRPEDRRPVVKMPTLDEMRSMTWQSVAAGANGLVFYSFFDVRKKDPDPARRAQYWNEVLTLAREVAARVEVMLSAEAAPAVEGVPPELVCRAWRKDGRDVLLVCNRTRRPVGADIRLGGRALHLDIEPIGVKWIE